MPDLVYSTITPNTGTLFTTTITGTSFSDGGWSMRTQLKYYALTTKPVFDAKRIRNTVLDKINKLNLHNELSNIVKIINNDFKFVSNNLDVVVDVFCYILYVMLQHKKYRNQISVHKVFEYLFKVTEDLDTITLDLTNEAMTFAWTKAHSRQIKCKDVLDICKSANNGIMGIRDANLSHTGTSTYYNYPSVTSDQFCQTEIAIRAYKACSEFIKTRQTDKNNYGNWKNYLFDFLILYRKPTNKSLLLDLMREFKSIIVNGLYGSYRKGLLTNYEALILMLGNFKSFNPNSSAPFNDFNPFKYSLEEYRKLNQYVLDHTKAGFLHTDTNTLNWSTSYSLTTNDVRFANTGIEIKKLRDWKIGENNPYGITYPDLIPLTNLLHVFGNADVVIQFCNKHELSLHDAGQFVVDFKGKIKPAWIHIFMESRKLLKFISRIPEIEQLLGRVPETVTECKNAINSLLGGMEMYEMYELGMDDFRIKHYDAYVQTTPTKTHECIPAPGGVTGITIEGYTLKQLTHNDVRQLFAGEYTDCCQHLFGAAASCAKASYEQPTASTWGVFKNGRMVAQSFVWRSGDTLVLDSIEYVKCNHETVAKLYVLAARDVINRLGVQAVTFNWEDNEVADRIADLSMIGATLKIDYEIDTPKPEFKLDYSDTDSSVVVMACTESFREVTKNLNEGNKTEERLATLNARFNTLD